MNQKTKNALWVIGVVSLVLTVPLAGPNGIAPLVLGALFISIVVYLMPMLVALNRDHDNTTAISALTVLLGWMLLPWIGALVWALSRNRTAELMHAVATAPAPLQPAAPLAASDDMRDCPMCAEPIKKAAVKCKHCGSEVLAAA